MKNISIPIVLAIITTFISGFSTVLAQRSITTSAGATLRVYSPEDGIPGLQVNNGTVTDDGFFWLSTMGGIVRISPMEIEDFGAEYGVHLMSFVYHDRRHNHTWFTDNVTLVQFDGSGFKRFTADEGFVLPGGNRSSTMAMHADLEGRLWIGSSTPPTDFPYNGGLLVLDNGEFKTISREQLPLHNVNGIRESSDGSIWFTSMGYHTGGRFNTEAWIARLDGTEFRIFDENDADSCSNITINFIPPDGVRPIIIEDVHGDFWFSCSGSFDSGQIRIVNNGIVHYSNGIFKKVHEVDSLRKSDFYYSTLTYDSEHDILYSGFFAQGGIQADDLNQSFLYHKDGKWQSQYIGDIEQVRHLNDMMSEGALFQITSGYFSISPEGQVYFNLTVSETQTSNFFSHLYILGEAGFRYIDTFPGSMIMNMPGNVFLIALYEPDVFGIYSPPRSRLLTDKDGLLPHAAQGGTLTPDSYGNIWVTYTNQLDVETGSWTGSGINMWDGESIHTFDTSDGITSNVLFKPVLLSDSTLWIPTDHGITRVGYEEDRISFTPVYGPGATPFRATSIAENRSNGDVWAYATMVTPATDNNPGLPFFLGLYNKSGSYFEQAANPFPDSLQSLPYHQYELFGDSSGRIWLIGRFSLSDNVLFNARSYIRIYENGEWRDPADEWDVPEKRLFNVGEIDNQRYFVIEGGFLQFDGNRFKDISDSASATADFRLLKRVDTQNMLFNIESPGHLYIRFRERGIAVFDGESLTYLDRRDGLNSARLLYPNMDTNGDYLFTTPSGGAIFNGKEYTFFRDDAVRDGSARAIARDKHGSLLILYLNLGLSVTRPDTVSYPVRLSSVTSDTLRFYEGQHPRLSYSRNNISFRFTSINFSESGDTRYSYFLDGHNRDWSAPVRQSFAEFRDLSPGNYTFRVRAVNHGNEFSEEAAYSFTVLNPWWRQWWALMIYGIILITGIISFDRYQRKRLNYIMREKTRERELEQAREIQKAYQELEIAHDNLKAAQSQLVQQEKLASLGQLTAGIAHEIKNPLNFVNNFSEVSIEMIDESREEVMLLKSKTFSATDGSRKPDVMSRTGNENVKGKDKGIDNVNDSGSISSRNTSGSGSQSGSGNDHSREVAGDFGTSLDLILENLDDVESNLKKILEHGTRADRIVKSMLLHSRSGSGKKEPVAINPLIREYVNLSYHGMRAGTNPIDVEIKFILDESAGEVPLIAEDFGRVILNLCNNAFDACAERSRSVSSEPSQIDSSELSRSESAERIRNKSADPTRSMISEQAQKGTYMPGLEVRTSRSDTSVRLEIRDNGSGMPDHVKAKILEPFFTTKKGTEGTGLGLSITHDIIKAHGGKIEIESTPGSGSAFIITLPG